MFGAYGGEGGWSKRVIVKTDQEPSIQYLVTDIREQRQEGKTIPEEAPVASSGNDGVVEKGGGKVERGIGALLLSCGNTQTCIIHKPLVSLASTTSI